MEMDMSALTTGLRRMVGLAIIAVASGAGELRSQSAKDFMAAGDREYALARPEAALRQYEKAIAAEPGHYESLWKASRSEIDLGEVEKDKDRRTAHYRAGELYARRAVDARPNDPEGHFHLARSLGRAALTLGPRDRVKYAGDVRSHALEALKLNPRHPGALHVMGVWNAEVMRLSGFTRFVARNLLGGKVFDSASWKEAVRYMEEAVSVEPERITHRLDLGIIYADIGEKAKAREQFERILRLPNSDPNDSMYKQQAQAALRDL
jgi:tetratricopeptide (TPR) repeat protein